MRRGLCRGQARRGHRESRSALARVSLALGESYTQLATASSCAREPRASKEPSRRDHGEVTLAGPSQLPGQWSLCKTLAQQLPGAAASGRAECAL